MDARAASHPEASGRGLGRYVTSLLTELPKVPGLSVTALSEEGDVREKDVALARIRRRRVHPRLDWYEHIGRIGRDAARVGAEVFHSPSLDPPLSYRRPWVQTLHDLTPLVFPSDDWGVEPFRWRVRGALMRRADAVVCVSQHTADLGIRHLGLDADRLHVVYHGVAPAFHEQVEPYVADRPYVLAVSAYGPHKGFAEAFAVAGKLADLGLPHELRLVGAHEPAHAGRIESLRRTAPDPERIVLEGELPDAELAARYRGAAAVVVTSRYEGFGLPALEAMAAGAAVVAFDNSAIGEIVGGGAMLVRDGDVAALADALRGVLTDDTASADLRRAGVARAAAFRWDRAAEEHAEIYALVA